MSSSARPKACCVRPACRPARISPNTTSAGLSTACNANGLVERHQCRIDGRNNVLVITAKGKALRRAMWPVYAAAIEEHFGAHLSQAEAEQLARLLAKVVRVEPS